MPLLALHQKVTGLRTAIELGAVIVVAAVELTWIAALVYATTRLVGAVT